MARRPIGKRHPGAHRVPASRPVLGNQDRWRLWTSQTLAPNPPNCCGASGRRHRQPSVIRPTRAEGSITASPRPRGRASGPYARPTEGARPCRTMAEGQRTCWSKRILVGKGESESGCGKHSAHRGTLSACGIRLTNSTLAFDARGHRSPNIRR